MTASAESRLFRLLLALVVLSPLPLGSARDWAEGLIAVWTGGLLGVWGVLAGLGRVQPAVPLARLWPMALPYALVLAWATAQALPFLPEDWRHPLWTEAARALAPDLASDPATHGAAAAGAVSLDPARSWEGILRLAAYAGIFFLSVQLGRDRGRARLGLKTFAWAGVAYAVYGLLAHLGGSGTILWMDKWAYRDDLTATFVNRNSYGAYAGLGLCCCLAAFARALPAGDWRQRDPRNLTEDILLGALPYLIGAGLLGTALMLTHSRGAFLSTILAIIGLMAALAAGRMVKARRAAILGATVVLLSGSILAVSGEVTVDRLADEDIRADGRAEIFRLTGLAIAASPWTGYGAGSFEPVFRIVRDSTLPEPVAFNHAHNMYLEAAAELGIPGAAGLVLSILAALLLCLRGLRKRRRDQIFPAVAVTAGLLLGAHSAVDFSLAMPAVAASFAFLLGLGCAQSWSSRESWNGAEPADDARPGQSAFRRSAGRFAPNRRRGARARPEPSSAG